uniref:Uncharacterized protein n=1 Tax=Moniliophthora roreri TaxID=221103 RepID=A0A0W0FYI0_MONRR
MSSTLQRMKQTDNETMIMEAREQRTIQAKINDSEGNKSDTHTSLSGTATPLDWFPFQLAREELLIVNREVASRLVEQQPLRDECWTNEQMSTHPDDFNQAR